MKNKANSGFFNKLTENLKTLLLIALIISSVYFAVQIFDSQYALGNGEQGSIFEYIKAWTDKVIGREKQNEYEYEPNAAFFSSIAPPCVVVNDGEYRNVYFESSEEYNEIYPITQGVISSLYTAEPMSQEMLPDDTEWRGALGVKSIYMKYNTHVSPRVVLRFLGASAEHVLQNISLYDEVIILPYSDEYLKGVTVYIRDINSSKIVKFVILADVNNLVKAMESSPKALSEYLFGFEITSAASDAFVMDGMDGMPLDSMLLIPVSTVRTPFIKPHSYITADAVTATLSPNITGEILKSFEYNANFLRQYAEKDNTTVFVDDYSTLKIDQAGVIEYKASDSRRGLNLFGDKRVAKQDQLYASINRIMDIIYNIQGAADAESNIGESHYRLKLSSPVDVEWFENEAIITFDYTYEGIDIDLDGSSAVIAAVKDGVLTYFKFYLTRFEADKESAPNEPMFSALQRYAEEKYISDNRLFYVKDARLCYKLNSVSGSVHTSWKVTEK